MKHARHQQKKMIVAIGLVLFMLVGSLSGCSTPTGTTPSDTPTASATASSTPTPVAEPTKIVIAMRTNTNVEDFNTNYFTKMIEKDMNVDLEFMMLPTKDDEAKTKIALMISSNTALPDVINGILDSVAAYDYATKGVLIKLDDYLKDPKIAVNFNKIAEKDFLLNVLKIEDGHIYCLPKYVPDQWNEGGYRCWINSAWLSNLKLNMPTTTDEMYNVLKEFVSKDPNGNKKKDEIGISGSQNGWAQNPLIFFMNPFIHANPDKQYFNVVNGKIVPAFTQPEWKQGLEYMNKLAKEGLLDPLAFTQDQTQMKATINVAGGMAGVVPSGSYSHFDVKALENKMTLLAPLKGPSGTANAPSNPTMPNNFWYITKDCKNPELVLKVGDYMLDEEVSKVGRYGEKGVDWTDDPAICAQYKGEYEDAGFKCTIAVLNNNIWNNPQNKHWNEGEPCYRSQVTIKSTGNVKKDNVDPLAAPNWKPAYQQMYVPVFLKEPITRLAYTDDDMKKIASSKAAIDKFVNDTAVQFITGVKPLSEWDSYLKELDNMGLADYVAAAQTAYEKGK